MLPAFQQKSRSTSSIRRLLAHLAAGFVLLCSGCAENEYVFKDETWQFKHIHGWDGTDFTRLPGVDVASFTAINELYAKDAHTVYFRGTPLKGADPKTFRIIADSHRIYYSTDSNAVFCNGFNLWGSDPSTFHLIDEYAVDKNHVYWDCKPMPMADARTFHKAGRYWMDRSHVFRLDKPVKDLNPNTLVQDPSGIWAHDDKLICVDINCIRPDDIESFRVIQGTYARDNVSFYAADSGLVPKKMHIVHEASFEVVDQTWAKDRATVYWTGTPLSGANPQTFKILQSAAGIDGDTCYFFGKKSDDRQCR